MKVFLILFFTGLVSFAESDRHLIFVNGLAEKSVAPNMVMVQIESWAKAPTAKLAQEQQSIQFSNIKTAFEKYKIKKEDIQTRGFSVYPEHTYDQKTQQSKISGYKVSHSILVIYRKTDDAGSFLDSLVTSKNEVSGVNIQSVLWDYDNKAAIETTVIEEAVKNARLKAEGLAKAAGVTIQAVHKIQHTSYDSPVAQPMFEKAALRMSSDSVAPPTELSTGQVKVKVEVQMEFEI